MRHIVTLLLLAVAPGFAANPARLDHSLPSFFIPNTGLTDSQLRFFVETPDLRAGFATDAALFEVHGLILRVKFAGANPGPQIEPEQQLTGRANFFIGNRRQDWHTGVPVYGRIRYRSLYPGIDMTYGSAGRLIKSEFQVAAGADPKAIRLEYAGADLSIDPGGALIVRRGQAEMREEAPLAYQESPGGETPVESHYVLLDRDTVGFETGAYDPGRPLIIDPTLTYATYVGGSGMSSVTGVAVDSGDNLYLTGWTESLDFPINGPVQASNGGGVDTFIAKLNPNGNGFLYATYIGGSGDDRGSGIAVDAAGEALVIGSTASSNFPVAAAAQTKLSGGHDAFAVKLSANGSALIYSTYWGGTNSDYGNAIAVDSSGNAYLAGDTMSANFPLASAVQSTFGGGTDAFLAKLSPAGAVIYSTFLGGSSTEHAGGVAVDASRNAYIAGGTSSTNFPVAGAIQTSNAGSEDVFLTKLNAAGSQIIYSTYLGGSGGGAGSLEQANAIAVDASGNAYLAGITNSANFPVTAGALQTSFTGAQDAFIAKVNASGNALVYSTFLGGSAFNSAGGLAVDGSGNAYAAGFTSSADFPVVAGLQGFNGMYDAFVSKLNAQGNSLAFSTFFGGTGSDEANAIAVDASGNMFLGGQTGSLDMTLVTPVQSRNVSGTSGWAARVGVTAPPPQLPSVVSVSPTSGSGNTVTFTAQYSDGGGAAALTSVALLLNTSASTSYACDVTYTLSTNQFTLANDVASSGSTAVNPGGGMAQNDQCTLNGASSSVTLAVSTLTMTVALSFQPGFPGAKTAYLYAADANSNTGWVAKGNWTVVIPPPQPTANSVSPNNSMGSSQTFTFVFSDTQNPLNITGMAMLFGTSLAQTHACSISVDRNAGTVSLLWDGGTGSDTKALSSSTILQNSQCQIGAASITLAGLSNIISLAITFKGAFSGTKNIYMYGSENGVYTTGWVLNGTYNVAAGGVPIPNSVVPASGSGPSQRFSFTVSDQGGASFLTGLAALISASPTATSNACYLVYDRTVNTVSLAYDNPNNGASPIIPGSSSVVSNSQCTLKAVNTTLVIGTTTIVLTVDITFNANFFGSKNVYLEAVEPGINSGWVSVGTWNVTGGAPVANSANPSSGSGLSPSFTFTVSDSTSSANISGIAMLITSGAPTNTANACQLVYNVAAGSIGLYNNAGATLSTKPVGSSATLQNSQCAVGYTIGYPSGNSVVFQVNLQFAPSFTAPATVYLDALEPNASSGWVQAGTWTP